MQRRTITPDRTDTTEDGRTVTVVTTKRYCDHDHLIGDATTEEIQAAIEGRPLPDVSGECRECTPIAGCPGVGEYGRGLTGKTVHWGCCPTSR